MSWNFQLQNETPPRDNALDSLRKRFQVNRRINTTPHTAPRVTPRELPTAQSTVVEYTPVPSAVKAAIALCLNSTAPLSVNDTRRDNTVSQQEQSDQNTFQLLGEKWSVLDVGEEIDPEHDETDEEESVVCIEDNRTNDSSTFDMVGPLRKRARSPGAEREHLYTQEQSRTQMSHGFSAQAHLQLFTQLKMGPDQFGKLKREVCGVEDALRHEQFRQDTVTLHSKPLKPLKKRNLGPDGRWNDVTMISNSRV